MTYMTDDDIANFLHVTSPFPSGRFVIDGAAHSPLVQLRNGTSLTNLFAM
jgi:hypothetical protein